MRGNGNGGDDLAAQILGLEFVGINSCRRRSTHPIVLANTDVNDDNDNNIVVCSWSTKVSTQNGMHTIHAPPVQLHVTLLLPLRLRIREACGARGVSGSTLVEVTVEHPTEVHQEVVMVTGSLHPGQIC